MKIIIRQEEPDDILAIEAVTKSAFLIHQHSSHTEQYITNALRKSAELTISLVAVINNEIVGHIAFSPVTISDAAVGWFGLGPLSVLPSFQSKGIGSQLVEKGLEGLKSIKAKGCVLLGDPKYYSRFGFKQNSHLILEGVPQEYFLALGFSGSLPIGLVNYSGAFEAQG